MVGGCRGRGQKSMVFGRCRPLHLGRSPGYLPHFFQPSLLHRSLPLPLRTCTSGIKSNDFCIQARCHIYCSARHCRQNDFITSLLDLLPQSALPSSTAGPVVAVRLTQADQQVAHRGAEGDRTDVPAVSYPTSTHHRYGQPSASSSGGID